MDPASELFFFSDGVQLRLIRRDLFLQSLDVGILLVYLVPQVIRSLSRRKDRRNGKKHNEQYPEGYLLKSPFVILILFHFFLILKR